MFAILAQPEVAAAIAAIIVALGAAIVRRLERDRVAKSARRAERRRLVHRHSLPPAEGDDTGRHDITLNGRKEE